MVELWIDDGAGPVRNPELTDEEFAAGLEQVKQNNIRMLWQAAHDYEYEQISGTATGLLVLGVSAQKPKSLAVQAWVTSIWALYYTRKPLITHEIQLEMLDFSGCGVIPFTVPDLLAEVLP